jgi:hypothetical protein
MQNSPDPHAPQLPTVRPVVAVLEVSLDVEAPVLLRLGVLPVPVPVAVAVPVSVPVAGAVTDSVPVSVPASVSVCVLPEAEPTEAEPLPVLVRAEEWTVAVDACADDVTTPDGSTKPQAPLATTSHVSTTAGAVARVNRGPRPADRGRPSSAAPSPR